MSAVIASRQKEEKTDEQQEKERDRYLVDLAVYNLKLTQNTVSCSNGYSFLLT